MGVVIASTRLLSPSCAALLHNHAALVWRQHGRHAIPANAQASGLHTCSVHHLYQLYAAADRQTDRQTEATYLHTHHAHAIHASTHARTHTHTHAHIIVMLAPQIRVRISGVRRERQLQEARTLRRTGRACEECTAMRGESLPHPPSPSYRTW